MTTDVAIAHFSTPGIAAYPWSDGYGAKYSNPGTLPSGDAYDVAFSPSGKAIAVSHQSGAVVSAYPWASGFGAKYSDPGTLPPSGGWSVAFSPDEDAIAVAHAGSPYVYAYQWSSSGIGTKYANPSSTPGAIGRGVSFSPQGDAVAVASQQSSPYFSMYEWSAGSGFGARYTDPGSAPAGLATHVEFSPNSKSVAVTLWASPFVSVYPWDASSGFGTKYANPSTALTGTATDVAFSPDGNTIACTVWGAASTVAYPWTGTGFGTRYPLPSPSLPANTGTGLSFTPAGDAVILAYRDSPYTYAQTWSEGFGTRYSNPATLPGGSGQKVAFTTTDHLPTTYAGISTSFAPAASQISIATPTHTTDDDLLIAAIGAPWTVTLSADQAGWTYFLGYLNNGLRVGWWWRRGGSGNYTWSINGVVNSEGVIFRVRDNGESSPIGSWATNTGASGTSLNFPSITTARDGALLLAFGGKNDVSEFSSSDLNERFDGMFTFAGTANQDTAGATGAKTVTASNSAAAWITSIVEIKGPAPVVLDQEIFPESIPSAEAFGTPTVTREEILFPASIPSGEAFPADIEINAPIVDTLDDGHYTNSGSRISTSISGGQFSTTTTYTTFMRFVHLNVDPGTQIDSATLRFNVKTRVGSPRIRFYGAAVDSIGNISDTVSLSTVTRTGASTLFIPPSTGIYEVDVTSQVQEIINRPGWLKENPIALIGDNASTGLFENRLTIEDLQELAGNPPSLHIYVDGKLPVVMPGPVDVAPTYISSEEAFGVPVITPGPVTVAPESIPSAEAFGEITFHHIETVTYRITRNDDDATYTYDVMTVELMDIDYDRVRVGNVIPDEYEFTAMWRFRSVFIPQGAQVLSALLETEVIEIENPGGNPSSLLKTIAMSDIDNAHVFIHPFAHPLYHLLGMGWGPEIRGYLSRDITDGVQEIVNRSGWQAGNALAVIVYESGFDGAIVEFEDYIAETPNSALLTVTYLRPQEFPQQITLDSIPSPEAFGVPTVEISSTYIELVSIPSAEAFGAPIVAPGAVTVAPEPITSEEQFGAPTLSTGPVDVLPDSIPSEESFGQATVVPEQVTIAPASIGSAEAFGAVTVSPDSVTILLGSIPSAEAFGQPLVSSSAIHVVLEPIPSAEAFGTPVVISGAVTIAPEGIEGAETFGLATVSSSITIAPESIPSAESFGLVSVSQTVFPGSIPSAESVGTITVSQTIHLDSVASEEAFGIPTVVQVVFPASIDSAEVFGPVTVTPGPVTIETESISSAEAFGTPAIYTGVGRVFPVSIPSAEDFGTPVVTPGAVTIVPEGIPGEEAFGVPTISVGGSSIRPESTPSAEAFGTPTVTTGPVTVYPESIASEAAFGEPHVRPGAVTVALEGIPSEEVFGEPRVSQSILLLSIPSDEAFGIITVIPGPRTIVPESIPSAEAFGVPAIGTVLAIYPEPIPSAEDFGIPTIKLLISSTAILPLETLRTHRVLAPLPYETLSLVEATGLIPLEVHTRIAQVANVPIAALQGLQADARMPIENFAAIVRRYLLLEGLVSGYEIDGVMDELLSLEGTTESSSNPRMIDLSLD